MMTAAGGWNADRVFPGGCVDRCLAPYRRIHHREQRRGDLHHRNAAHVGRRDEAGEIADDATTQRNDRRVAPAAVREQGVGDRGPTLARLVLLAGGNDDRVHAITRHAATGSFDQRRGDVVEIVRRDVVIGDDDISMRRGALLDDPSDLREAARRDDDRVTERVDGPHAVTR